MTTIKTTIRNRRIDVPAPSDVPDGTEVTVIIGASDADDSGPLSPEEIARVLAAMKKVEPFEMTPQEDAEIEAWRQKIKEYTIAKMHEGVEDVFR
jgi:hypothetical protein